VFKREGEQDASHGTSEANGDDRRSALRLSDRQRNGRAGPHADDSKDLVSTVCA
jgi:hypothetical protein